MSSREFWAAEAAKMRDTSALFDMSHLVTDNRKTGSNSNSVVKEYFFTANIVNESSMTVDHISESVQYAQDIYFRNKISISFRVNIMSEKDALIRKIFSKHDTNLFLGIKTPSTGGVTKLNSYGDIIVSNDDKNISTFVSWGYAKELALTKKGNSIYLLGYVIAHEFFHQLSAKAKGGDYASHTDEMNSYGLPKNDLGNAVSSEPNLNMSGPYVQEYVPANWNSELRPAESLFEVHKLLLREYLKSIKWD